MRVFEPASPEPRPFDKLRVAPSIVEGRTATEQEDFRCTP
jgi:hypothetical protein